MKNYFFDTIYNDSKYVCVYISPVGSSISRIGDINTANITKSAGSSSPFPYLTKTIAVPVEAGIWPSFQSKEV